MGLRDIAKNAVKQAKAVAADFFIACEHYEANTGYTPGSTSGGAPTLLDSFTAFDIEYDKELNEVLPFVQGERYMGLDPDELSQELKLGRTIHVTGPDGTERKYTITGLALVQQDVLILMRLKPGG